MTGKQFIEDLTKRLESDGELDEQLTLADLLDNAATIGLKDASALYVFYLRGQIPEGGGKQI